MNLARIVLRQGEITLANFTLLRSLTHRLEDRYTQVHNAQRSFICADAVSVCDRKAWKPISLSEWKTKRVIVKIKFEIRNKGGLKEDTQRWFSSRNLESKRGEWWEITHHHHHHLPTCHRFSVRGSGNHTHIIRQLRSHIHTRTHIWPRSCSHANTYIGQVCVWAYIRHQEPLGWHQTQTHRGMPAVVPHLGRCMFAPVLG